MFKTVGPGKPRELENFEKLGRVKILRRRNDIYHLVEIVLVVPLYGASDVTGEVDGSSV
jgi:hypothetical protein